MVHRFHFFFSTKLHDHSMKFSLLSPLIKASLYGWRIASTLWLYFMRSSRPSKVNASILRFSIGFTRWEYKEVLNCIVMLENGIHIFCLRYNNSCANKSSQIMLFPYYLTITALQNDISILSIIRTIKRAWSSTSIWLKLVLATKYDQYDR